MISPPFEDDLEASAFSMPALSLKDVEGASHHESCLWGENTRYQDSEVERDDMVDLRSIGPARDGPSGGIFREPSGLTLRRLRKRILYGKEAAC